MGRTLGDVGEFGLIERVRRVAARAGGSDDVVLGIGDDAAVLRLRARPRERVAVTTDAFVENVHFRLHTRAPATLGRQVLAATLSDLAAMGARPLGFVLALAAPASLPLRTLDGLARGLAAGAREWRCPLVGGNVTRARETVLTLTAVGAVGSRTLLRRDAGRAGDGLFVTGVLGAGALAVARAERTGARVRRVPEPRLAAGRALGRFPGRGACIDVSDGLVADLGHVLAAAGGLGAELDVDALPVPAGFPAACRKLGLDPSALALSGGEDYELLFSARGPGATPAALARRLGVRVTRIGRLRKGGGLRRAGSGERPIPSGSSRGAAGGWRHF